MIELEQLTGWDYLVFLIALVSFGLGLLRGMSRTVADLASWLLASIAAPFIAGKVSEIFGMQAYFALSVVLSFVLTFFLVRLMGVLIAKSLNSMGLSGADKALGGFAGAARAALIIAALATGARMLDLNKQPAWQNALSRPLLDAVSEALLPYVPELSTLRSKVRQRT